MARAKAKNRTVQEKEAIIKEFQNRPEGVTIRQVADKHNTSVALIYNWIHIKESGKSLDPRKPGPVGKGAPAKPKNKAAVEAHREKAAALAVAKQLSLPATQKPASPTTEIRISGRANDFAAQIEELQSENERLRAELAIVRADALTFRGMVRGALDAARN